MTVPPGGRRFRSQRAEEMRLRAVYRGLVLRGKLKVSREAQRDLVGPDCAYHLYRNIRRKN